MAIRIQKRSWENQDGSKTVTWRLIVEDFSSGERKSIYPEKRHYHRYGFDPDAPFEQAKATLKTVQAKNKLERLSERKARIEQRVALQDLKESAYLPKGLYKEFLDWLCERRIWDEIPKKSHSHLRCMRAMILDINTDPSEWGDRPERIYRWFIKKGHSLSYLKKVLPVINDYGYFYCREFKSPFLAVKFPNSLVASKIEKANHLARDGKTNESFPLTKKHLSKLGTFSPEKLRWVRASLFFGLRPAEVDRLAKPDENWWKFEKDGRGTWILHVKQSKLVRALAKKRWKKIPCILPEQVELMIELRAGAKVERPYAKYLQKHLGEGYTLYAGRKGFDGLMKESRQSQLNILRWKGIQDLNALREDLGDGSMAEFKEISLMLGHSDVNTTERHYRDEEVDYDLLQ